MQKTGIIEIKNIALNSFQGKALENFQVRWEDYEDSNIIQLDIYGSGLLNYEGKLTEEMKVEINTNILNALIKYGELTNHKPIDMGYTINLNQTKKHNKDYNSFVAELDISFYYKKPIKKATAYSLQPTTELITSIILGEIFVLGRNVRKI
jgi:hypothetical protein